MSPPAPHENRLPSQGRPRFVVDILHPCALLADQAREQKWGECLQDHKYKQTIKVMNRAIFVNENNIDVPFHFGTHMLCIQYCKASGIVLHNTYDKYSAYVYYDVHTSASPPVLNR